MSFLAKFNLTHQMFNSTTELFVLIIIALCKMARIIYCIVNTALCVFVLSCMIVQ